ncbi:MAG: L-threonylcarbamoyladenylate synthase [Actinomycetota bacterium]
MTVGSSRQAELLDPERDRHAVERAAAALERGELVAFPTETVYGLGADASSATAVERIFAAKGRPRGHPLIVHLSDDAAADPELAGLGRGFGPHARALAAAFWPGPLTLIVERGPRVVAEATGWRDTVGLRVPDHPVALDLLRRFGRGIAGPSANRFGSVSPTTAAHVLADLDGRVDAVLDGGPCRVGVESTIVDVTGPVPALLRPGGISAVEIEGVLGRPVVDDRVGEPRASGMLASHYAPNVAVELVSGEGLDDVLASDELASKTVGVIRPGDPGPGPSVGPSWVLPTDASGYASQLYAAMRAADDAGLDRLLVVAPTEGDLLDAVLDRLAKAAAPRSSTS